MLVSFSPSASYEYVKNNDVVDADNAAKTEHPQRFAAHRGGTHVDTFGGEQFRRWFSRFLSHRLSTRHVDIVQERETGQAYRAYRSGWFS